MSAFEGGKEGAEGKWSARTADAPCIKPLLWEPLGMRQFKAKAPLFGNIRIEKWGSKLNVLWSVPGLCASFIDGDFPDEDTAKAAAQTEFERRILEVVT
ncbi:hypothetical protein [Tateyamaria sp.]|uniref:hypothetical protein n=1 Tax=Tateyamaria sp. TaxID=1929288 RepID=UPI003B20F699